MVEILFFTNIEYGRFSKMANIIDKFLDSMKLNDDEYEDEYDEFDDNYDDEYGEEPEPQTRYSESDRYSSRRGSSSASGSSQSSRYSEKTSAREIDRSRGEEKRAASRAKKSSSDNIVSMRSRQTSSYGQSNMEVCMMKPNSFNDAMDVCNILLEGRAALINLEGLDTESAQRVIDFVSGACYSISGKMKMVSSYIFMASPKTISLSGDFSEKVNIHPSDDFDDDEAF